MNPIQNKNEFNAPAVVHSSLTPQVLIGKISLLVLLLFTVGCTYSFSGANLGGIKTVAVPVFDNITSEPGIRERVTNELVRAILDDNNFKIADLKLADAVIAGKITKIDDVPFTFEGSGNTFSTTDYKITITTTIRFENKKEKKTLWEESVTGWGRYTLQGDKRRNDGIDEAVKMITQNVLNKVVSDW